MHLLQRVVGIEKLLDREAAYDEQVFRLVLPKLQLGCRVAIGRLFELRHGDVLISRQFAQSRRFFNVCLPRHTVAKEDQAQVV